MGRKKNTETEIITPVEEIETVEEQDVIGQASDSRFFGVLPQLWQGRQGDSPSSAAGSNRYGSRSNPADRAAAAHSDL